MLRHNSQSLILGGTVLMFGVFLTLFIILLVQFLHDRSNRVSDAKNIAETMALRAATSIEEQVSSLEVARRIAEEFSATSVSDDAEAIENYLKQEAENYPNISALTVAFAPDFVPESVPQPEGKNYGKRLYSPYTYSNGEDYDIINVEDFYDYTLPDPSTLPGCGITGVPGPEHCQRPRTIWYTGPIDADGPVWSEPYAGTSNPGAYWAGFGIPFYRTHPVTNKRTQAGMISADMTLEDIQTLIAELTPGNPGDGYAFIVSGGGVFVSHPTVDFVTKRRTLTDFDAALTVDRLRAEFDRNGDGELLVLDHEDPISGQVSWAFFAPVENAGWWIGIILDKDQIFRGGGFLSKQRNQLGLITTSALGLLVFLSALILRADRGASSRLWAVAIVFSLLSVSAIGFLWILNLQDDPEEGARNVELVDRAISDKIVSDLAKSISNDYQANPIDIPTGVFINSLEFASANSVTVSGFIWQKFTQEALDFLDIGDSPGFVLPEAGDSTIVELYRRKEGDNEVRGWSFTAVLHQDFDFQKYPFDREDVWLRIWPAKFNRAAYLTPDLVSYDRTKPELLPGLDQELNIAGWDVTSSFFSFRPHTYNTNFGIQDFVGQRDSLELYYNVSLKRQYMNPFVSSFIPIFVVALLLFAVLVTNTTQEGRAQLFGFSTAAVLSFCAGLFFVVVISHINLRGNLATQGIIYLESFYFVLYAAILIVALNSILVAQGVQYALISYRDNFIPRLFYWPILLGILFVITLLSFS